MFFLPINCSTQNLVYHKLLIKYMIKLSGKAASAPIFKKHREDFLISRAEVLLTAWGKLGENEFSLTEFIE